MKYLKVTIIFIFLVFGSGITWYINNVNSLKWARYYKSKIGLPARENIIKSLSLFKEDNKSPGIAIDLGAGVGNDAVLLLKDGWRVVAIDSEPKAIDIIKNRKDIQAYKNNLTTIVSKFEDLDWSTLPDAHFIYASYSLPFSDPSKFNVIWQNITHKLLPGGRFAGHFFGINSEAKAKIYLTKEQVLSLFKGFKIEDFEETHGKNKSGTGEIVNEHSFSVIAKKSNN